MSQPINAERENLIKKADDQFERRKFYERTDRKNVFQGYFIGKNSESVRYFEAGVILVKKEMGIYGFRYTVSKRKLPWSSISNNFLSFLVMSTV